MMPTQPPWVAKGIADIIGLDDETVKVAIIPELESHTSEVRLRGYLTDFLGTTPPARAFADRYVAFRFPSLANTSTPTPARTEDSDLAKPNLTPSHTPRGREPKLSRAAKAVRDSAAGPSFVPPHDFPGAVNAAFGPNAHVYKKTQDDGEGFFRGGSGSGQHRSHPGSGAATPRLHAPAPLRAGGAITITEAKAKPKKDKGKEQEKGDKIWDVPKSKETLRLEGIVQSLRELQAGEGKPAPLESPPCFCQARVHPLSTYTPQCAACGLVLCTLQPTQAACPSCAHRTLSPPALARLIVRVEGDVAAQISKEADLREERERARKERLLAESGGGAFPTLPGGPGAQQQRKHTSAEAARKVLTINKPGKGKGRATITTTTYTSVPTPPPASPSTTPAPPVDDSIPRPRSAPLDAARVAKDLAKVLAARAQEDRPWGNPQGERRGEVWAYVEPIVIALSGDEGTGRRAKGKKKGVGLNGRVVVGAATR